MTQKNFKTKTKDATLHRILKDFIVFFKIFHDLAIFSKVLQGFENSAKFSNNLQKPTTK